MSDDLEERGSRLERAMFGEQGSADAEEMEETEEAEETEETKEASKSKDKLEMVETEETDKIEETEEGKETKERVEGEETAASVETVETDAGGEVQEAKETSETNSPVTTAEDHSDVESSMEEKQQTGCQGSRPLVQETHDLHMYLPESRYQDLVGLYKVLDGEYYRKEGTDLEKNRQYFDAVIQVALDHEAEIREQLGL